MIYTRHVHVDCPDCAYGEDSPTVLDVRTGDVVCVGCGLLVGDERLSLPQSVYSRGDCAPLRTVSGTYQRKYHLNERLAQRAGREPLVPQDVLDAVEDELGATIDTCTAQSIARALGSVERKYPDFRRAKKCYSERWVSLGHSNVSMFSNGHDA